MSAITKTASALFTDGASTPTDQYDHEISLVDHTRPVEEPLSPQETEWDPTTPLSPTSSVDPLRHLWTREGLRTELTRRKYKRYQEGRVVDQPRPQPQTWPSLGVNEEPPAASDNQPQSALTTISQALDQSAPALSRKRDTIRHHKNKVKDAVKDTVRGPRPKHQHTDDESLFDVLYENQRGAFFCGIPRFSSNSLLNFDPPAWQTQTFHPSPVDITNAQLPDPSWVWAKGWQNWYVDMSFGLHEPIGATGNKGRPASRARGDTDEEGWRYSFAFGRRGRWAWHGTHPWFHSFVRRRRWVRLRVKRGHALAPEGARMKVKPENEGHMLNAEYFTIHNVGRPSSQYTERTDASERQEDKRYSAITSKRWSKPEGQHDGGMPTEISDMPSLMKALRKAAIDREKIAAVRVFLDNGGDELHYLAENMHDIMSLLVFQTSKQQLRDMLSTRLHDAERQNEKAKHKEKAHDPSNMPVIGQTSLIDNLRNALAAADNERHRLEYWSDQHDVDRSKVQNAADECEESEEDNDYPIGETTVFSDDVEDGKLGTVGMDGTREPESLAAPDRPPEQDESTRRQTGTGSDHGLEGEGQTPSSEDEGTVSAVDDAEGDIDKSEQPNADDLSTSPEDLKRFETASEGRSDEGDVGSEMQKTIISDYGQSAR